MDKPKFSVSICVYEKDSPEWFKTAVDSILNQSIAPNEVVLTVDGPVPPELDCIIQNYELLPNFKVVRLSKNVGHGEARRICLEQCSNNIVALMDADDISLYNRFEKQLSIFENNPNISIVGGNIVEFIDIVENVVSKRVVALSDSEIKNDLKKRCPFNQMSVMFRRDHVLKVGGYKDWYCDEDYYLWIRMYLAGMKFANVSDTLVYVRIGKDMYNRRGGIKYFISEAKLQKYMLVNKIISPAMFLSNCAKRLIVQVLLPNRIRGWIFRKFARKSVN
ncbi:MAG: glycosyltransferase [Clostridia bacterium]|nr:glycosyltransferase [Clostridia bacterium]